MEKSAVSKATAIDFVITWVDGSDPEWLRSKQSFQCTAKADDAVERYRDWGLLKFRFRGVEAFAPMGAPNPFCHLWTCPQLARNEPSTVAYCSTCRRYAPGRMPNL